MIIYSEWRTAYYIVISEWSVIDIIVEEICMSPIVEPAIVRRKGMYPVSEIVRSCAEESSRTVIRDEIPVMRMLVHTSAPMIKMNVSCRAA